MCGIAGIYLRDPEFECDLDAMMGSLLSSIDHRGKHACGFVAIGDDGVNEWQKAAVQAAAFNRHRRSVPRGTRVILAHTRWATQGDPGFMENNHPVRRGPFFIIHNGHVSNDYELFRKAERDRFGKVDSEAIAARLASFGDLANIDDVMAEIRGSAAVAAVDERDCTRLAFAKGTSSPVHVYVGEKIVVFASTKWAVENAYKKVIGTPGNKNFHELKEGDAWELRDGILIKRTFEVQKPYVYTSNDYSGLYGYGGAVIVDGKGGSKSSKKGEKKEKKEREEGTQTKPWALGPARSLDPDQDMVQCENCSDSIFWEDVNYFYLKDEKMTFHVCEDCFEMLVEMEEGEQDDDDDEERQLAIEQSNDYDKRGRSLYSIEDEIERVDDFDGANRSVLRNFTNGWF